MRALLLFVAAASAQAYSVLTHEAIIDSAWTHELSPLIERRFPGGTEEAMRKAHAYAYGGCILQDMGYYPFGSKFFSDLTHYVRSGDFVMRLVAEAQDRDEYAFALGALAHYTADTEGHPLAVNRAVAMVYPELAKQYGTSIPYERNPAAHVKTEFGFDVLQVAQGSYAPQAYHDFIGFEVAKPLLERAFSATYGLELKDVFASVDLALGSYRHAVSRLIPEATRVAWELQKDKLTIATPGLTRKRFVYNLSRASYESEWGREYSRPGFGARFLAFLFRLLPRFGPFRALQFKAPPPEAAVLFMNSFNRTLEVFRGRLKDAEANRLKLENRDLDTGKATTRGEYGLADGTYSRLVRKLADRDTAGLDAPLRDNILAFYGTRGIAGELREKDRRKTLEALRKLQAAAVPR